MRIQRDCLLMFLACWVALSAQAEVFRWVDDEGKTHFGDRPPANQDASPVTIKSRPGTKSVPSAAGQGERSQRQRKMLDAYADEREQKREARREREAAREERKKQCAEAKDRYRSYERAGSFYKVGPDGKRHYVSREQHESILKQAADQVAALCK